MVFEMLRWLVCVKVCQIIRGGGLMFGFVFTWVAVDVVSVAFMLNIKFGCMSAMLVVSRRVLWFRIKADINM